MLLDISEVTALASDIANAGDGLEPRVKQVIAKTGLDVTADGQALAKVDTGAMRASTGVDIDPDGFGFEAGPTVDYAEFQELGTSKMAPSPFMGPAFDRRIPSAIDALGQVAEQALGS